MTVFIDMWRQGIFFLLTVFCLSSCATRSVNLSDPLKSKKDLADYFDHSDPFNDHFSGFVLYDLDESEYVFDRNADKYFTPASNVKLWTLYAALEILDDSIGWMAYQDEQNKRIFFPLGDPSYLHPHLNKNTRLENYFTDHFQPGDTIYFSVDHFHDWRFGAGWMWDDQSYYFQAEKSVFPIHGNCVKLTPVANEEVLHEPEWMTVLAGYSDYPLIYREEFQNVFILPRGQSSVRYMPVIIDRDHYRAYFQSLGLHLEFVSRPFDASTTKTIYSMPSIDLYRYCMDKSDNLVAEQLLLQCGMEMFNEMNQEKTIDSLMTGLFSTYSDELRWYDGSGLSRYNLVTPKTTVQIVNDLVKTHGFLHISAILPTLSQNEDELAADASASFGIYAKSGSMKYCYNLSGLVLAKSGKHYAFSFMNNQFTQQSEEIRGAVLDLLEGIMNNG